ncbi:MAG: BREX system P-loop protein BrxC [Candidatus Cloacimonetes bacterium]|nr:BREX system P-loop protein BrxC [Candidatus Cloacimonadota bacterium]
MLNRNIYIKDPTLVKLVNEGVANVNDERTDQALEVLRYELETFVCDGQYEKGLNHILETYLKNINQAQQPSVWISGFYGSGKSHLAKMLRALWLDTVFPDGATARGIANLPHSTRDLLKELSIQAKRLGGLHAASGTLGSGSSNVRLTLLGIVFKSLGLPEQYQKAKFVMWLKQEKIFDQIRDYVVSTGADWDEELDNFYVAEQLHEALMKVKPNVFLSHQVCMDTLLNLYPNSDDISIDEMLKALRSALQDEGKIPLTAIILDEMQQYIGESSERSLDVMETVEMCAKNIGGKLIIVATGQSAITGTANLKKLEGRFTIPIQLSDNDVDTVIRKVFLAKKPEALPHLQHIYNSNIGEISRHLSGSAIAHQAIDAEYFAQDYPILPVRRRFWEEALRVLDLTGTASQLRNQLSTVHKATQSNVKRPLGSVIPADFLYFDSATKLLQARLLPNRLYEQTMLWKNSANEAERLLSRACGLIFLINKISAHNPNLGIRAQISTLADLLLDDITLDSGYLRGKLPHLLDNCPLLMKVNDEYRIQTEESVAWDGEFQAQKQNLASTSQLIDSEREERIKQFFIQTTKGISLLQGKSKVSRDLSHGFGSSYPAEHTEKLCIWLRNGWSTDEASARVDARQLGNDASLITVYLPKKHSDTFRTLLLDIKAADTTLQRKGNPNTPEGIEARAAIETIKHSAELRLQELLQELFAEAKVILAGGSELFDPKLKNSLQNALESALLRLYPKFGEADDSRWAKVFEKAMRGAPDALSAIDYTANPAEHPVCKAILSFLGSGKKGDEIRKYFEKPPYGWSRDSIDGALAVLLVAGIILAYDERNQPLEIAALERKAIGKTLFKRESVVLETSHRIQIRRLYQKLGIACKSGDEATSAPDFIAKLCELLDAAGGDAPLPLKADTSKIDEMKLLSGNERLMAIYSNFDELSVQIDSAYSLREQVQSRLPAFRELEQLLSHATGLPDIELIQSQVQQIVSQRLLLAQPDPVSPILAALSQSFRTELNRLKEEYTTALAEGEKSLNAQENWQQLDSAQELDIRKSHQLDAKAAPAFALADTAAILKTLNKNTLSAIRDKIAAIPIRYSKALEDAAKYWEPTAHTLNLPKTTLKNHEDIENYILELKEILIQALNKGPILIN